MEITEDVTIKLCNDFQCHLCLKDSLILSQFSDSEAAEMLRFCGFWKPEESPNFPNQICQNCTEKITIAHEVKKLCIASQNYFNSIIITENNLTSQSNITDPELKTKTEKNMIIYLEFRCSYCNEAYQSDIKLLEHDTVCTQKRIQEFINLEVEHGNNVKIKDNDTKDIPTQPLPQLSCDQCKNKFSHSQDLKIHQSVHSTDASCNQCEKVFSSMKRLKRHIKIHMTMKDHVCKDCSKEFTESGALAKHIRKHHLGMPVEKKYQCLQCGQGFQDQYYLNIHIKKHTGERNIVCNICRKSFYDPRSMTAHMRTHRGEKNYKCAICSKSFSQSGSMHNHIKSVHIGDNPHSCQVCKRRFSLKSLLNKHMKVHERQRMEHDLKQKALEKAALELVS